MRYDCDVMRHECNVMRHDCDVMRHDCDVMRHDCDVMRYDCDVMRHDCDVMRHDCDVMRHDCDVMRHDCDVTRHDCDVINCRSPAMINFSATSFVRDSCHSTRRGPFSFSQMLAQLGEQSAMIIGVLTSASFDDDSATAAAAN